MISSNPRQVLEEEKKKRGVLTRQSDTQSKDATPALTCQGEERKEEQEESATLRKRVQSTCPLFGEWCFRQSHREWLGVGMKFRTLSLLSSPYPARSMSLVKVVCPESAVMRFSRMPGALGGSRKLGAGISTSIVSLLVLLVGVSTGRFALLLFLRDLVRSRSGV